MPALYEDLTGTGFVTTNHGAVSHIAYLVTPVTTTGSGTVVKAWTGDEFDDTGVTVTFTAKINDGEPFTMAPDDTVTLEFDQTLTITDESVTGLPTTCRYVSDLPDEIGASFTATEDHPDGTITVTNDVTCREEGGGSGTVAKAWTGDTFDHTGVTVTFTAIVGDGEPFTMVPGDTEPLAIGETLTITDETVTGLPTTCSYVSNLPENGASFTATSRHARRHHHRHQRRHLHAAPPPPPPPSGADRDRSPRHGPATP